MTIKGVNQGSFTNLQTEWRTCIKETARPLANGMRASHTNAQMQGAMTRSEEYFTRGILRERVLERAVT